MGCARQASHPANRQMEELRKRKRGETRDDAFVDMKCFDYPTKYALCVSVQHLDVLCAQSDGFKYLLHGHPAMQKEQQINLSLFETYGVDRREACILMHWAEHGCFLNGDEQLRRSVQSGLLREACVSLGGGFGSLLDAAYRTVKKHPALPGEDVNDEFEWKVIDFEAFHPNNEELEKVQAEGWVFVDQHISSTAAVKRCIFNRKRATSMKTQ